MNLQQEHITTLTGDCTNRFRETITIIWMNDNVVLNTLWFKQGSISGVVEKCLDSGSTFSMEMTGHANKLNEGHA